MESDKEKLQKLCNLLKKIDPEEKVFKQETILDNTKYEYKKELNNNEQNIHEKEHNKKDSSK